MKSIADKKLKEQEKKIKALLKETGVKHPKKRKTSAKIKKIVGHKLGERVRGDVVAEVMKKHNLTLPQASKYVKEHNLY
jgi:hypothetical protein